MDAPMRLLFVIPHFFNKSNESSAATALTGKHGSTSGQVETRVLALRRTVYALHQTFGNNQRMIQIVDRQTTPANQSFRHEIHVVLVTTGMSHVLDQAAIPNDLAHRFTVDDNPELLGFFAHRVLRDRWGNYDYYCYLEDDLALEDPWFFEKLRWFNSYVGDRKVLLPNRFERSEQHVFKKVYLDGALAKRVTEAFQDIDQMQELRSEVMGRTLRFLRPTNPHAGCFFLNAEQMRHWISQPHFESMDTSFIGPLASAASLGVMKAFEVYKPACENASFLEIEHADPRFIPLIRFENKD